jgi:hypothetical protein
MTYLVCPDAPAVTEYATVRIAWELSKATTIPHLIREPGRTSGGAGAISASAAGRGGYETSKLALWL